MNTAMEKLTFTPKTETQLIEEGLLPKGDYEFEVMNTEFKYSKANNPMIVLKLRIFNEHAEPAAIITDYLMTDNQLKLCRAAKACGLLEEYEKGELHCEDFRNKTGRVSLYIKKDKDPQYPDKNAVGFYISKKEPETSGGGTSKPMQQGGIAAMLNDDIPFMCEWRV